jgi:NAD-dependent dihydropyrimidine dehydrogenase PreA subunit
MGIFIRVEIDPERCAPDGGKRLTEVCPVNVFSWQEDRLVTDPENEDECTLCGLCLRVYPEGAVRVQRLYRDEPFTG